MEKCSVTYEQRLKGGEKAIHGDIWEKTHSKRKKHALQGLEVEACVVFRMMEVRGAGGECIKLRVVISEVRDVMEMRGSRAFAAIVQIVAFTLNILGKHSRV